MELIKVENEVRTLNAKFVDEIIKELKLVDALTESTKNKKEMLLKEMEEKNIRKIETDALSITYIDPSERESFNSKKFREEHQDLYDEYVTFTQVKGSVRIKVK